MSASEHPVRISRSRRSPALSIVSVNYNNSRLLADCLDRSIEKLRGIDYEIILVDNCSSDDSYDFLVSRFASNERVRVVRSDRNGGFGYGCNFGAELATSPVLWFLNSDAWITNIKGLSEVLNLMALRDTGMVGTSAYLVDGSPCPQGGGDVSFSYLLLSSLRLGRLFRILPSHMRDLVVRLHRLAPGAVGRYLKSFDHANQSSTYVSQAVGGASFLISRYAFDELGGFDEGFFLYDEDGDLSARAVKSGYRNYVCPSIVTQMYLSATTSKLGNSQLKWIKLQSRQRLIRKHFSGIKRSLLLLVTRLTWKLL
ncbi:MAG TPA: glycosyltransferase family 2 protein [Nitrospiraceae bacterium]|nr:glycosyltransferase family 2 protein [Nitrospiraceae bacterium]